MTANQTPTSSPDFQARSALALKCLPDAPYRDMLAGLHDAMLARIEWLDANNAALQRQVAETAKGHAMYEHVRTLNPMEFGRLWSVNLQGKGPFDGLVLADMDKRKEDQA